MERDVNPILPSSRIFLLALLVSSFAMSRRAKRRDDIDIFTFSDEPPELPKRRLSTRPARSMSVRLPPSTNGKLTTAERLKLVKKVNGQRLTQSAQRRQRREREKAEAYRKILIRRKEDPNLVLDLTDDSPLGNQVEQPVQPEELVSEDDEDEDDFTEPRTLFHSPQSGKHVSRQSERLPPQQSASTCVMEVSDDENVPRSLLKRRRVAKPSKRIGLPVSSAVFAPSVKNAISQGVKQNKAARDIPRTPRTPLNPVNGLRKDFRHISKLATPPQDVRRDWYPQPKHNKHNRTDSSGSREMVLHISTIPPSNEDIQEIHQISDDEYVGSSHGDPYKQNDLARGTSKSVKTSRQTLKRPRHFRQLDRSIPTKTFYRKNHTSKSDYHRGQERVVIPLSKGQKAKAPTKEIGRLNLEEKEYHRHKGLDDGQPQKPNRRHARGPLQYESDDEDELNRSPVDIRFKRLSRSELEVVKSLTFKVPKSRVMAKVPEANIELKAGDFSGLRGSRWLNDEILNSFVSLLNARNKDQVGAASKEISARNDAKGEEDDEIMEVAVASAKPMEVFRRPRPHTHVFNTFFFARLSQHGYDYNGVRRWLKKAGRDIKELDLIMFPINLSNFHWVLAAIDLRGKQFLYLDSTYGEDSSGTIPLLRRWLHDEVKDKHGDAVAADMQIDSWGSIVNPSYLPRQRDGGSCGIFTLYMAEYLERGIRPDFTQDNIRTLRQRTALFLKQGKLPA